jgi:WD40 repeat protein
VVAGTNTGELFVWKVDFAKFAERSLFGGGARGNTDLFRYLG